MAKHKAVIVCDHVELADPNHPKGYLEWHEWSDEQHRRGRRQKQCGKCGLWYWPRLPSHAAVGPVDGEKK